MELSLFTVFRDFAIAFVIAFCWGILFGSSKRVLWVAGLLGGLGHCLRFVLVQLDLGIITATLAGSVFIGIVGIFASHKVDTPPVVFTMPACITMIPGLFAYRTMLAGIKITDSSILENDPFLLQEIAHNLTLTMSLLFSLAIGICIGALLFRKSSARDISMKDFLNRNKIRK